MTGRFYNGLVEARAHEQAYDPEARRRLWDLSESLAGLPDPLGRGRDERDRVAPGRVVARPPRRHAPSRGRAAPRPPASPSRWCSTAALRPPRRRRGRALRLPPRSERGRRRHRGDGGRRPLSGRPDGGHLRLRARAARALVRGRRGGGGVPAPPGRRGAMADPRYRVAFLDWMACAVGERGAGRRGPRRRWAIRWPPATAGHVLDFDDTYLPGLAHLSAPTAPAALRGASSAARWGRCSTPTPPGSRRWGRSRARVTPPCTTAASIPPRPAEAWARPWPPRR